MSNDLIQKLMISKAIIDKHNNIPRGNSPEINSPQSVAVQDFSAPQAINPLHSYSALPSVEVDVKLTQSADFL